MPDYIELRSDTFTRPCSQMLEAMMKAPVGDDVFGEDPTVNELEAYTAGLFGMEAALFCPSGTMTNQIALRCHTERGDEIICEKNAHVFSHEGGGMASNSACQARVIEGERGLLTAQQIIEHINPDDPHKARTALVSLENTSNRGGGACYDFEELRKIKTVCVEHQLGLHLDGARLFNALTAKKETPESYGSLFDSISVCLSKGLGAPVGSILLGSNTLIKKARRVRKSMGGGMRQAGYLAAAGLYALKNNVTKLANDHKNARLLAETLNTLPWVEKIAPVETNIVIFKIKSTFGNAQQLCSRLKEHGVLCLTVSASEVRMVSHLDVSEKQIINVCEILKTLNFN